MILYADTTVRLKGLNMKFQGSVIVVPLEVDNSIQSSSLSILEIMSN
jgi:hypothetical protein